MSDKKHAAFLGVIAATGVVNTIAVADDDSIIECFRAGEIIVPCTLEQARVTWGQKVLEPPSLGGKS